MKRYLMIPLFAFLFSSFITPGCGSSVDLPSTEESQRTIDGVKPKIDALDSLIGVRSASLPKGFDIISRTRLSAVNMLMDRVTSAGTNDIHIDFLNTRPLWKEGKSLLGIEYTNHVDIDTGKIDIDLKKFRFTNVENNVVNAEIEIEGIGKIKVSGKYSGMPASANPQIQFYLSDRIRFAMTVADSDFIKLTPIPQTVMLKTKVTINLLGWSIPYYREIPLSSSELIKPVIIPSAIRSEIVFPIPASQFGQQQFELVKRYINFTKTTVSTANNLLEYRGNIDFSKE